MRGRDREVAEMHEAVVRLSENQHTLASAIADWRHESHTDFGTVTAALEKMTTPYINVVAVKRGNAEAVWAQDIVAGYRSQTFKTAILSDRFYDGFALPDYLK